MMKHLTADALMEHVTYLADGIGPRPAASTQERLAADYVRRVLADAGVESLYEQPFATHDRVGWRSLPYLVTATLLIPIGWFNSRVVKFLAGLGLAGTALGLRETMLSKPTPFESLIMRHTSQNIVVPIRPTGDTRRRIVLTAHLDTQTVRKTMPRNNPDLTKPFNTVGLGLLALLGGSMVWDAFTSSKKIRWWQVGGFLLAAYSTLEAVFDDRNPHVDGANDNATAVAIALQMAQHLAQNPPEHTEVVILFSGSEEVGCTGMENFLRAHPYDPGRTFFITLEMLGKGRVGYVQRHGISHFSEYVPGPRTTVVARQVAERMGLRAHEAVITEEHAVIDRYGYDGVVLTALDAEGHLPNWHRETDTTAHIEPDTLAQAAAYTWALIEEIDRRETMP